MYSIWIEFLFKEQWVISFNYFRFIINNKIYNVSKDREQKSTLQEKRTEDLEIYCHFYYSKNL